jgi:hypothetical protein
MSVWSGDFNNFTSNIFCKSTEKEFHIYSNDNVIIQNEYHGNINGTKLSDNGERNHFGNNYYSNWSEPDSNIDGIVDIPYLIEGSAYNQDLYPQVNPFNHILMPPYLYSPIGGEIVDKIISIYWEPSFDTFDHQFSYSIYFSSNAGHNWYLLADNLTTSSYFWNVSSMANGQNYMIKIVVCCLDGLNSVIISDRSFIIRNHLLSPLIIVYPNSGDKLNGVVIIGWKKVNDSLDHQIMYSLFFSSNNGESWTLLALRQANTSFEWDTTLVQDGSRYKIMVTAECSEKESISIWGGNRIYAAKFGEKAILNLENLQLSTCFGTLSEDGWNIKTKTENCPFDKIKLRSMIEISAVIYQQGKQGEIYGPFPQMMTQDSLERQWQFISYSFIGKREFFKDLGMDGETDEFQIMLLLFYERQFEELITLKKESIQKYLNSLTKKPENTIESIDDWLTEIEDRIVELISS